MDWKLVKDFLSFGQAFIPVNAADKGDCVQLIFKDGSTKMLDMKSEIFLKKLLYYFGTSISANRNRYGKLVGKKKLVPIVLSYGMTLIPYAVRTPIGRQAKHGWFLAKEIMNFSRISQYETLVELSNYSISVLHSEKHCLEQLKNARCIELCYGEIHEPYRKKWVFSAG